MKRERVFKKLAGNDVDVMASHTGDEFDDAVLCGENRVIPPDASAFARVELRSVLAHDDIPCQDLFSGVLLYAEPLAARVAAIARRSLSFFMCHGCLLLGLLLDNLFLLTGSPFLLLYNSLVLFPAALDLLNLHLRRVLAVSPRLQESLLGAKMLHNDLAAPRLVENGEYNLCLLDIRLSEHDIVAVKDHQDLVGFIARAFVMGKLVGEENCPRFDQILLPA